MYRSMHLQVPAAAVGLWAVAAISTGSGFEPAPGSCGRWRHGQARLAEEAPPAKPREFKRAADRAAEPLRHLTAGGGCEVKRIGQAVAAAVKLIL